MAYDETVAERLREVLARRKNVTEQKMFGGICFLLNGKVCCGIHRNNLILRLGSEQADGALLHPDVRVFDITGKAMKGWVMVAPNGFRAEDQLTDWVEQAVRFTRSLRGK